MFKDTDLGFKEIQSIMVEGGNPGKWVHTGLGCRCASTEGLQGLRVIKGNCRVRHH